MDINPTDSQQTPENIPAIPHEAQPSRTGSRPIRITALVAAALVIGLACGYLLRVYTTPTNTTGRATLQGPWHKLASNKKGFPITNSQSSSLTYYSIEKAKAITLNNIKVGGGSGMAGVGNNKPIASPDLRYIAFIGADNNLWLFSNDTEQTQQLTNNGFVSYISAWSPDSKKLLYYYDHNTIDGSNGAVDGPAPKTITFKPQFEQGFYQTNIDTGEVTPLAALDDVEGYIDNNTLLVKPSNQSPLLAAFNLNTFTADMARINVQAGFGVGQFSFSSDGKLWAYLDPQNKAEPTKGETPIVMGSYPNAATTVVDSGQWADVQHPMFSPNNQKIAYQKTMGRVGGITQDHVWIYDIASGAKTDVGDGDVVRWTDDSTVLIQKHITPTDSHTKLALLNIETKQAQPVEN